MNRDRIATTRRDFAALVRSLAGIPPRSGGEA
jgi:hypothetical protein